MILPTVELLLQLFEHTEGFPAPVRDLGALESAVHRQHSSLFGNELYPTLDLKVAALMDSIARSHPLIDGNKRLTLIAAIATFDANGRQVIHGTVEELEDFILQVSSEHMEVEDIAQRLTTTFTTH